MESTLALESFIAEPAIRHQPQATSDVRPDATRVIFSPLVNVTVSQTRKFPFGVLASLTLTEEWFPVKDVPVHARHRVSPDPNDPNTWGNAPDGKLPAPKLASVLVNPDLALARLLATYSEQGCREIIALREKPASEIRSVQVKLFGAVQVRTYADTVTAIKAALDQHKDDKLVVSTAREILKLSEEAVRACELYWQGRKVEIMRAANGDKTFTAHPDNYDLRICEYAGIDPTQTEADALRAEVLRGQMQPAAGLPSPELFAEALKTAIAEGVRAGVEAVTATRADQKNAKQAR